MPRKTALWLVAGLALPVCIVVPWREEWTVGQSPHGNNALGYGLIFSPPTVSEDTGAVSGVSVDIPRWAIGALLAAVVSFVLIRTSRDTAS
jgi:hypothetical protein